MQYTQHDFFFQLQRLQSRICDLLTVDSPSNRKKIDVCVAVSQIEIENMNFSRNNRRLKSASSLNSRLKNWPHFFDNFPHSGDFHRPGCFPLFLIFYPLLLTASLSLNTALSLTFIAKQGCGEKGQQQLCQEPLNARIISEKDPPVSKLHTTYYFIRQMYSMYFSSFQRVVFCIN